MLNLEIDKLAITLCFITVVLLRASVSAGDLDVSAHIECMGVEGFVVPRNQRACYRTRIEGDPCNPENCTAEIIPRTNFSITFEPSVPSAENSPLQAKIWSPGKIRAIPRNYQNNRLCQYHLVCPEGQLLYFGFNERNFDLEPEQDGLCLDYVFIEDLSDGSFALCDSQAPRAWFRAAPLRIEFRSNAGGRYPGFQIDALCVRPELADLPDCTPLPDGDESNSTSTVMGRRRRSALLNRDKRTAVPLIGNSLRLPRNGFLLYSHNVLQVIVNNTIARRFRNIQRLFFWTGFNGTRVFRKSTKEFIFGAGELRIIKDCAYYFTLDIPPQLEPNLRELALINLLLNATAPFYRDQDVLDPDDAPPTKFPPHLGLNPFIGVGIDIHKLRYGRSAGGQHLDPRISLEALETAENWQNACNVFLRESAASYLLILAENGILP